MQPEFVLSQEQLGSDGRVIAVRGEVDLFTAPALKDALATRSRRRSTGLSST
jgi:hypothetical protein